MTYDYKYRPVFSTSAANPAKAKLGTHGTGLSEKGPVGFPTANTFSSQSPRMLSVREFLTGRASNDTMGVTDPSTGVHDPVLGVYDDTLGVYDDTLGVYDDTIGVYDDTIGVFDDTIGVEMTLDGTLALGPERNPLKQMANEARFARLEVPGFSATGSEARRIVLAQGAKFGTADRAQFAKVVQALDDDGVRLMGALMSQAPGRLFNRDSKGGTLLSSLARIATQPLNPSLAGDTTQAQLLGAMVREIVNPCRVVQGKALTCTVTSMQYELVAAQPAEYARLLAGLTGPGTVTMRGGEKLSLGDKYGSTLGGRPVSQAIFQSACMEFANGFMTYAPENGSSTDTAIGFTQQGLKPQQETVILDQLFGVDYSTTLIEGEAQGANALLALQGYDASREPGKPVIVDVEASNKLGRFNHAVTLKSVKAGLVEFRDPYGVIRSMPMTDFQKYVVAVHQPQG